jgi:hypothetical protein
MSGRLYWGSTVFTHSLFCPLTLFIVYVIFSLISCDICLTISAIWYVVPTFNCVQWNTHILFFSGIMFWTLHLGESEIEGVCHWIQFWIKLNFEWKKKLHQGTINRGSTVVDILIPNMFYSPSIAWRHFVYAFLHALSFCTCTLICYDLFLLNK